MGAEDAAAGRHTARPRSDGGHRPTRCASLPRGDTATPTTRPADRRPVTATRRVSVARDGTDWQVCCETARRHALPTRGTTAQAGPHSVPRARSLRAPHAVDGVNRQVKTGSGAPPDHRPTPCPPTPPDRATQVRQSDRPERRRDDTQHTGARALQGPRTRPAPSSHRPRLLPRHYLICRRSPLPFTLRCSSHLLNTSLHLCPSHSSLAAAPPPAPPLSTPGLPCQIYLAGRGRAVQREAVDGPSSKAQA